MEKRILFIANDSGPYGANQSLLNIVSFLKSKDVFVRVVFPYVGPVCDLFKERGWDYEIVNFRYELRPKTRGGISFLFNVLRNYYKIAKNLIALKILSDLVDDNNINIIHSNSSVITIGLDLAKLKNVIHVWHLREYIHPNYNLYVFGGLRKYKIKIQNSSNIICITNGVAKWFNIGSNAFVLRDAIRKEPKYFQPISKSKYFLFCGSLNKNKGVEEAIMCFYKVFLKNSDYKLLIVGAGPLDYEEYLKEKVKNLNLKDSVKFLGFREDIDDLMVKATAFLMCSRNEALGRVTIEAMLNFCVVFGYNDGGTAELIEHSKTGFLYNNQEELVGYMMDIINSVESFNLVRENAYQYATSNFLEEKFGINLLEYYDSLDKKKSYIKN